MAGSKAGGRHGGLVLTRHLDESIMIGEEIEVRVVGMKPGAVRLMITRPARSPCIAGKSTTRSAETPADRPAVAPGAGTARGPAGIGSLVLSRRPRNRS